MLHSAIGLKQAVPPDEPSRDESNASGALCHLPISDERTLVASLCLGFHAPRRFAAFERDFVETYARHATDAWLRASRQEEERAARVRAEALRAS